MVLELIRDAIAIKMKIKEESPLISVYEFCYAAGLGCKIMKVPDEEADRLTDMESFADFKACVQELTKASEDAFSAYPNGTRLYRLLMGCRYKGQMDADAIKLFQMGFGEGAAL